MTTELGQCPWAPTHHLLSIGLQGKILRETEVPNRNLVFLIDVSGSMGSPLKLPLLKQSLKMLVDGLRPQDKISIVVYAGHSGLALAPTSGEDKTKILAVLDELAAGGSTNGADGIELAYRLAGEHFQPQGINRVILCTDGDFNVGVTSQSELVRLIEKERTRGVFLSVLGFGMGNLKDSTLELLADRGNGNYAYIDSLFEARKVLVEQGGGTLVTIAKDVKIQVEFNPAQVQAYRLLGYENRMLQDQDFNNDKVDAGEIGSGQSVTALYELIPPGQPAPSTEVDPLKYQQPPEVSPSAEVATVKLRYKLPEDSSSQLLSTTVAPDVRPVEECSRNLRFASCVAAFANQLRAQPEAPNCATLLDWAREAKGADREGYQADFLRLLESASKLTLAR